MSGAAPRGVHGEAEVLVAAVGWMGCRGVICHGGSGGRRGLMEWKWCENSVM